MTLSTLYLGSMSTWFQPLIVGVTLGAADFLFSTTCEKAGRLAGMTFEECEDEDEDDKDDAATDPILPSQRWDRCFMTGVILIPIGEELIFRGLLQPLCKTLIGRCFPYLIGSSALGLSGAALVSSLAIGMIFGALHYLNYKTNGWFPALVITIGGVAYGVAKERYGLICSIVAHSMKNNCVGLLDKYYPAFLESEQDQLRRLQPAQA